MASGEIIIDKDFLDSERANFSQCQKKFKSGAYNTYKSSYLCNSGNTWVNKLKTKLDVKYQKMDKGYQSIVEWWTNYSSEVDRNESDIGSKKDKVDTTNNFSKSLFKQIFNSSTILNPNFGAAAALGSLTTSLFKTNKKEEVKKGSTNIMSGIGETVKTIADAAESSVKKIDGTTSTESSSNSNADLSSGASSTGSTSASIEGSTTNADSVNKVEQSSGNTTGTNNSSQGNVSNDVNNTDGSQSNITNGGSQNNSGSNASNGSNSGTISDNVNNTDGNKSNVTNGGSQNTGGSSTSNGSNNGTISDNVNNTDGDKSNITNGTNSGTSGTDIGSGNVTEDLLKTKIEKAIKDYNSTHTSQLLPALDYNEFEDIIRELKEIGLTDDEIAQTVVEIMRAKYY